MNIHAKDCYDGGTCRNEDLVDDLRKALEIAVEALESYRLGKTWSFIAGDALTEIENIVPISAFKVEVQK